MKVTVGSKEIPKQRIPLEAYLRFRVMRFVPLSRHPMRDLLSDSIHPVLRQPARNSSIRSMPRQQYAPGEQ